VNSISTLKKDTIFCSSYLTLCQDEKLNTYFYFCATNSLAKFPPIHNWSLLSNDEGKGVDPAPKVQALFEK